MNKSKKMKPSNPKEDSLTILSRRYQRKQEVRGRINDAAIMLLTEKKFELLMVDEVCELAEVARKTFYNYYSSKDELLRSLCNALFYAEMDNLVDMAIEKYDSIAERFTFVFESVGQTLAEYEALERNLIQYTMSSLNFENNQISHEVQMIDAAYTRLITAEQKKNKNSECPWSTEFLIELMIGFTISMVIHWVFNPNYNLESRIKELSQFLHDMLK